MNRVDPSEPRRHAPATSRNRAAILGVLSRILPPTGLVLEVAAGTGEHAAFMATALPDLVWQPTDPDPLALASIEGHRQAAGLSNLRPAISLDARDAEWPIHAADAVVSINMIHIASWSACAGLLAGAARVLPPNGALYLYGPFMVDGAHTAESNRRFDLDLRARNHDWGVRDLVEVTGMATRCGLSLDEAVSMPANNLSVVFRNKN